MPRVRVTPEVFELVMFDAAEIAAASERLATDAGLAADLDVLVEVDEAAQAQRVMLTSMDPVVLAVQGGALEDPKRPRQLSTEAMDDAFGRAFFRLADRLDPRFGDPPLDADIALRESTAWDSYCWGRTERAGHVLNRQRHLYHFRMRHGFSDVADAAFNRLWMADSLKWSDILDVSAETAAVASPD